MTLCRKWDVHIEIISLRKTGVAFFSGNENDNENGNESFLVLTKMMRKKHDESSTFWSDRDH